MVSIGKKKNKQKNQLSQFHETLFGFVIGNCVDVKILERKNLEKR